MFGCYKEGSALPMGRGGVEPSRRLRVRFAPIPFLLTRSTDTGTISMEERQPEEEEKSVDHENGAEGRRRDGEAEDGL